MRRVVPAIAVACSFLLGACGVASPTPSPVRPTSTATAPPGAPVTPPPSASLATTSPAASAVPSTSAPAATPTPGPSRIPAEVGAATYACASAVDVSAVVPASEPVPLVNVRTAVHGGLDRIVFEFSGDVVPGLDVEPAAPPFTTDASGLPVDVPGTAHLRIHFPFATGMTTYTGPARFGAAGMQLVSLVQTGDFEGVLTWAAGLSGPTCYRVSILGSPVRVVVDLYPGPPAS